MSRAVLIVDPQNDFFPGGALAVPEGDSIVKPILRLMAANRDSLVVVSKDWHPENTVHFAAQGGIWPPHCIANTDGATVRLEIQDFLERFYYPSDVKVFIKGFDPKDDGGYSAFDGLNVQDDSVLEAGESLVGMLTRKGITELVVCGLATDYCVKATVLDAIKHRFKVYLYLEGMRAVNIKPHDGEEALSTMFSAGAMPFILGE